MKPGKFKAAIKRGTLNQDKNREQYIVCINCSNVRARKHSFNFRRQFDLNEHPDMTKIPEGQVLTVRKEGFGNLNLINTEKTHQNTCSRECAAQITENNNKLVKCDNKHCSQILPFNKMTELRLKDDNDYTLLDRQTTEAEKHIAQQIEGIVIGKEGNYYCSSQCATADKL